MSGGNEDQEEKRYSEWEGKDLYEFWATVGKHGQDNVLIRSYEEKGDDGPEPYLDVVDRKTGKVLGHYDFGHSCPGAPGCLEGG